MLSSFLKAIVSSRYITENLQVCLMCVSSTPFIELLILQVCFFIYGTLLLICPVIWKGVPCSLADAIRVLLPLSTAGTLLHESSVSDNPRIRSLVMVGSWCLISLCTRRCFMPCWSLNSRIWNKLKPRMKVSSARLCFCSCQTLGPPPVRVWQQNHGVVMTG